MQAIFRFRGDQEIVISNQVNGVLVEIYEGMHPANMPETHENGKDSHSPKLCSKERCGVEPWTERRVTMLTLSKSEGRSIASSIMGAAAEL